MREMNSTFKETEIGPIPVDWEVVSLQDAATLTRKPKGLNISDYETVPFIPMELVPDNGTFVEQYELKPGSSIRSGTYCEKGDILLAKITPSFENGKQGIVGDLPLDFAYATTEVYPIQVMPDRLDRMFLFHFLRLPNVRADIAGKMEGSTGRQRVPKAVIENYPIPLPPLPEQRHIAHVLSTIQRAIAAQDDLIAAAREVKRSLMQRLFTYGPGSEPAPTKETQIGEIPEHWEVVPLAEMAKIERGKFAHRPRNDPRFYGGTTPFIQTGDVANSGGRITTYSQTLNDLGLSVSRIFPRGTIVITIAANIGYTAILEFDCAFPDSLIGITPTSSVDNVFLEYYLQTQQPEMDRLAPRGTQKNINIQFLKPWPIRKPPLAEQQEIAKILSAADRRIAAEEQRKAALQALFKAMLHQLMTGQIRSRDIE